jgi:uncharacterized protein involved in exopolysaccharide biosynthesis
VTLLGFIRLLLRNVRLLVLVPVVVGAATFLLTRGQPKEYTTHATVHTGIVSGYQVDQERGKVDYQAVRSAFDNLIGTVEARSTLQAVALQLLAHGLSPSDSTEGALREAVRDEAGDALPPALRSRLRAATVEATLDRLNRAFPTSEPLRRLVLASKTAVSVEGLRSNLKVHRVGASDLLEVRYTAQNAQLAHRTLALLLEEVRSRAGSQRLERLGGVVAFFDKQARRAKDKLDRRVARLRQFGVEHEVINYNEQTEAIAQARERVADALTEERMRLTAARRARDSLARRIGDRRALLQDREGLLQLRQALSAGHARSVLESVGRASGSTGSPAEAPATQGALPAVDTVESSLDHSLKRLHALSFSPSGVDRTTLLGRWLDRSMTVTEASSRVDALEARLQEFRDQYRTLAPLGSELAGIEREVDLAENQYLEALRSLNEARTRQKSARGRQSFRIIDAPFVPSKPKPTQRLVLVAVASVAGWILVLAGLVALSLLDRTLRTPNRAAAATGLELASAYPVLPHPSSPASGSASGGSAAGAEAAEVEAAEVEAAEQQRMHRILDAQLLRSLQAAGVDGPSGGPTVLLVTSPRPQEGKTTVARRLAHTLAGEGASVRLLQPGSDAAPHASAQPEDAQAGDAQAGGVREDSYSSDVPLSSLPDILDRLSGEEVGRTSPDVVLVEVPPLIERALPGDLAARADGTLVVVRADHGWARADSSALDALQAATASPPLLVLNGTSREALDPIVGDLAHERSRLRQRLKRWVRLELRAPLAFGHEEASSPTSRQSA